jgi:hypothetical protein
MPRILIVTANSKTTPLQLAAEQRGIRDAIGEWSNFKISYETEARVQDLIRHLRDEQPDILHFAGHGVGGSNRALSVKADNGNEAALTQRDLGDILENLPKRPRLIVLNACYSAQLAVELVKWVDVVIGADGAIGDDPARRFAISLYGAMGKSVSVYAAYKLAKTELKVAGYDAGCLTIDHRPEIDPGKLVFYAHPELMAQFVLSESGKPKVSKGHYYLYLWLRGVDELFECASFQVCHDSFAIEDRYWDVTRSESSTFSTDDFFTRGDVTIRVTAWSRDHGVGVEASVGAALRRHYGDQLKPEILRALEAVEAN